MKNINSNNDNYSLNQRKPNQKTQPHNKQTNKSWNQIHWESFVDRGGNSVTTAKCPWNHFLKGILELPVPHAVNSVSLLEVPQSTEQLPPDPETGRRLGGLQVGKHGTAACVGFCVARFW